MTTRNRTGDSNEKKGKKCAKSVDADVQDGDGMRSAILEIIRTDEDLMTAVVDSVSQAIVAKFLHNPNTTHSLAALPACSEKSICLGTNATASTSSPAVVKGASFPKQQKRLSTVEHAPAQALLITHLVITRIRV